ncbi:hypothetical protein Ancab_033705 [Ancistrocladus abbreviatus]
MPKSSEDWRKGNWSGGCVRQTELLCEKNVTGNLTSGRGGSDGVWKLSAMKLPDSYQYLSNEDAQGCQNWCLIKKKNRTALIVSLTTTLIVIISIISITYAMCKLKAKRRGKKLLHSM